MSRWRFLLAQLTGRLWLRAALYAVLGVAVALMAALFSPLVPRSLAKPFGGGTVTGLMNIMASSLLAVATFSVAAMLSAFTNISQGATPRAATLVAGNRQAQGALATFVGAFLYAVVGYSALGTGYYGAGGRAILFFVTLFMLAIVAVTLLRWLDQLLRLARVDHAIAAVEREATSAMQSVFRLDSPGCGGRPGLQPATSIEAGEVGYVQNVDVETLRITAAEASVDIFIEAIPGAFTLPRTALATVRGELADSARERLRKAFTLGPERSFAQDPQFGLIVLSEIASHALSPGINNPGIAKDVITSLVRLLCRWMDLNADPAPQDAGRVHWVAPTLKDLLEDALLLISKDGAASVTVAVRLQNVLAAMSERAASADRDTIRQFAREALERSRNAVDHPPDLLRIRNAAGALGAAA